MHLWSCFAHQKSCLLINHSISTKVHFKLMQHRESVVGSVIQATGSVEFEDDLWIGNHLMARVRTIPGVRPGAVCTPGFLRGQTAWVRVAAWCVEPGAGFDPRQPTEGQNAKSGSEIVLGVIVLRFDIISYHWPS